MRKSGAADRVNLLPALAAQQQELGTPKDEATMIREVVGSWPKNWIVRHDQPSCGVHIVDQRGRHFRDIDKNPEVGASREMSAEKRLLSWGRKSQDVMGDA